MLRCEGLIAKERSIVDACFVEALRQQNTREQNKQIKEGQRPNEVDLRTTKGCQKDCHARWVKKGEETYYGYKNHAKVDAKSKLIDKAKTPPAQVHDNQVFKDLVDESDQTALADSAYYSEENED